MTETCGYTKHFRCLHGNNELDSHGDRLAMRPQGDQEAVMTLKPSWNDLTISQSKYTRTTDKKFQETISCLILTGNLCGSLFFCQNETVFSHKSRFSTVPAVVPV